MSSSDQEYVRFPKAHLDAILELIADDDDHDERVRADGYREGQAAATHGYQTGYDLGHDTGSSARQDTRQYVHGILDGWAAGRKERQQLAERLLRQARPKRPEREREPAEREAGS